jgi:hypothetical protein
MSLPMLPGNYRERAQARRERIEQILSGRSVSGGSIGADSSSRLSRENLLKSLPGEENQGCSLLTTSENSFQPISVAEMQRLMRGV